MRVAKFGGTSLANAEQFRKVRDICQTFGDEYCVVLSAPGKRFKGDIKVTDLLYSLYKAIIGNDSTEITRLHNEIATRYNDIANELDITFSADIELDNAIEAVRNKKQGEDYLVSRGEYMSALLMSKYLDCEFVDAAEFIMLDEDGALLLKKTQKAAERTLKTKKRAVIPGFYGTDVSTGKVRTFSRGGSDVTGSIVARGAGAKIYENWTDVSGFFAADPRIVERVKKVEMLDFSELRELSCMGASVLHGSTVLPLVDSDIAIRVCNTNRPQDRGTIIKNGSRSEKVAGIAGKSGYTVVFINKLALLDLSGFARRVLHVFEACSIPVEHMPVGLDNLSVITFTDALEGKREMLVKELLSVLGDVDVEFYDGIALIAAVSARLSKKAEFACVMFGALAKADIPIRMIDHGSGANSIVVGVDERDAEMAIRVIYSEFEEHEYV